MVYNINNKLNAWGNHTIEDNSNLNLGELNPFRYRGYYYDTVTGLYYLKARYYDPTIGRFISMDSVEYVDPDIANGLNLYAYCGDNPIMNVDPSGSWFFTILLSGLIGALIGGGVSIASQKISNDSINWGKTLFDLALGAVSGIIGFSKITRFGSTLLSGIIGAVGSIGGDIIQNNGQLAKIDWVRAINIAAISSAIGFWAGAGVRNAKAMVNAINEGKTIAGRAFLMSSAEALVRPNSGLVLQTMYINMAKSISQYKIISTIKVVLGMVVSSLFGGLV